MTPKRQKSLLVRLIALAAIFASVLYCGSRGSTQWPGGSNTIASATSPEVPEDYVALKEEIKSVLQARGAGGAAYSLKILSQARLSA